MDKNIDKKLDTILLRSDNKTYKNINKFLNYQISNKP